MRRTTATAIAALCALSLGFAAPVFATATYFGPSFSATPTSPGGPVYLTVSTTSGPAFVNPPSGSGSACPSGQTCNYPLDACTDPTSFFFSIHSVTVTDPDGNVYVLGSSAASGMYWPSLLGGPTPTPTTLPLSDGIGNQGDALNVTIGDTFVLPFGAGAGGFSFTTSLGSPPETHSPEGPYYWWTGAVNVHGSNLRLDQNPGINPTILPGTYVADIAGAANCGSGVSFDAQIQFTESASVPQFSAPLAATIATAFLAVAIVRKKNSFPTRA